MKTKSVVAVVFCLFLFIITHSAHAANCAWWNYVDQSSPKTAYAVKFGYVMGAYGTIGDLYGMLYPISGVPVKKIKELTATKENIILIIANVDIFCAEERNASVSIPFYLEILLRLEAEIINKQTMLHEEEMLRSLLATGSPQ